MRKENRVRLEYVKAIFAELGFSEEEIEIRSILALTYQLWGRTDSYANCSQETQEGADQ